MYEELKITKEDAVKYFNRLKREYEEDCCIYEVQYRLAKKYNEKAKAEHFKYLAEKTKKEELMYKMAIAALKTVQMYSTPTDSQNLIDYVEKRLEYAKGGVEDPSRVDELEKLITWMLSEKEGNNNE